MFTRKTLFVLGAGTSFEVGLPLGSDLASIIGQKMDVRFERAGLNQAGSGDFELYDFIKQSLRPKGNDYQRAAWVIRDGIGFAQSIDDFLDQHRANDHVNLYGKAAIVKAVLEAERSSKLYFDINKGGAFRPSQFSETWFVKFMHTLGRGIPKENVREIFKNVSFIIFNYDRCVEFFLSNALQQLYNISESEASAIIDDLSITHPYGCIGDLRKVPFGSSRADYVQLAQGIKTYTEQVGGTQIAIEVANAGCIVFLGFAYHRQNMQLLQPSQPIPIVPIYGTAYNMSDSDVDVISHQLVTFFQSKSKDQHNENQIKIENRLTCAGLFNNYARSLSGGD
jgi:hypothetical protein